MIFDDVNLLQKSILVVVFFFLVTVGILGTVFIAYSDGKSCESFTDKNHGNQWRANDRR